jgi:hypothetical protein
LAHGSENIACQGGGAPPRPAQIRIAGLVLKNFMDKMSPSQRSQLKIGGLPKPCQIGESEGSQDIKSLRYVNILPGEIATGNGCFLVGQSVAFPPLLRQAFLFLPPSINEPVLPLAVLTLPTHHFSSLLSRSPCSHSAPVTRRPSLVALRP